MIKFVSFAVALASAYPDAKRTLKRARVVLRRRDENFVPLGDGNGKTGLPGFYRPVGGSCPLDCPYLEKGCYAQTGNVRTHQKRASLCAVECARSMALCAAASLTHNGRPCRAFVSGDIFRKGQVDKALVKILCETGRLLQEAFAVKTVAYGYTHAPPGTVAVSQLREAGIELLQSDVCEPGGAIVWPYSRLSELREKYPAVRFTRCPAMLTGHKVTCRECFLCTEARATGRCIVFEAHGSKKKKVQLRDY